MQASAFYAEKGMGPNLEGNLNPKLCTIHLFHPLPPAYEDWAIALSWNTAMKQGRLHAAAGGAKPNWLSHICKQRRLPFLDW